MDRSSAETPDGDVDRMDVGEDQLQRTEVTEPDDLPVKKRARCEDQTKDQVSRSSPVPIRVPHMKTLHYRPLLIFLDGRSRYPIKFWGQELPGQKVR